jgi:hypothetical protein
MRHLQSACRPYLNTTITRSYGSFALGRNSTSFLLRLQPFGNTGAWSWHVDLLIVLPPVRSDVNTIPYDLIATGGVLILLPLVPLLLRVQKQLVEGILAGAVKE